MARSRTPLADFLKKMHRQPKLAAQVRANPKAILARSGLSPAHKRLLLDGDRQKLANALVEEHLQARPESAKNASLAVNMGWIVIGAAGTTPSTQPPPGPWGGPIVINGAAGTSGK